MILGGISLGTRLIEALKQARTPRNVARLALLRGVFIPHAPAKDYTMVKPDTARVMAAPELAKQRN